MSCEDPALEIYKIIYGARPHSQMKKFLVQIQPGAQTRCNLADDLLAHLIAREVGRIVEANSTGPVPLVSVIAEECRCELCERGEH
jgi:hypothetical protein